jgi:hypothetical protein
LVPGGLLRRFPRSKSSRSRNRRAPIFSRRFLAPSHQSHTLRRPLQHPARIPLRGLWLPRRLLKSLYQNPFNSPHNEKACAHLDLMSQPSRQIAHYNVSSRRGTDSRPRRLRRITRSCQISSSRCYLEHRAAAAIRSCAKSALTRLGMEAGS